MYIGITVNAGFDAESQVNSSEHESSDTTDEEQVQVYQQCIVLLHTFGQS